MTHKNTQHKSYSRGRSFIGALLGNLTAVLALSLCTSANATIIGPYSPDSNTLHLWHMDTNAVPVVDSVSGGKNLTGMANDATLGNASYSDFGTALSTFDGGQDGIAATNKDAYLSALPLVNGGGDNVAMGYADPVTGAFTYEAIIRVDFDPAKSFNSVANGGNGRLAFMQLITGDDEANAGRGFQFRIVPIGVSAGNTSVNLEFANVHLAVAPIQTITIPIPTTGPDAIASNNWYHVAVVYDGNENAVDNIRFYWTLLDPSRTIANEIGTWSMQFDLPTASSDFAIGNIGRNPANGNFIGLIDEVRISKGVRQTNEMMFAIPEVVVTTQPIELTVGIEQPAAFSIRAVGERPIYYQWRHDGTNLTGATQDAFSIGAAQFADAGEYDVVVTNSVSAVTSSVVTLTVRTPINIVWNPSASSDWNIADMNWDSNNDFAADTAFSPGDNVRFDSQGAATPSVNLVGVLTPSSVVVEADTDYTFTTASGGAISSNARLAKRGTGTLTLDADNSYTGATVIEQGTLQVGAGAGRGQLGSGPVTNNGALVFNRTGSLSLGSTLAGTGSLTNNAAGVVTISGTNLLSGPITLNAGGLSLANLQAKGNPTSILLNASANSAGTTALSVSGGMVFGSGVPFSFLGTSASPDYRCSFNASDSTNSVSGPVLLDGSGVVQFSANGTGQLDILGHITGSTLTGSLLLRASGNGNGNIYGSINLPNASVNKTDGGVWTVWSTGNSWTNSAVVSGTLRLGVSQALPTNMVLRMGQANSTGIVDLAGFNQQVGGLGDNLLGGSEIIGNSSTNSDSLLTLATTNTWLFSGLIQDAISNGTHKVAFTLAGGTLTLTNRSTYSGDTTISAGTLALTGIGSISNSLTIDIASGATLSASGRSDGTYTLNAAQTLQGNGAFYVLGNLTNKGTIRLKLNKAGAVLSNDSINGANQISYGGTLNLVITGDALGTNDTFKLFNATTYAGAFASIVPATPGAGLAWTTTTLAADGTLRVFPMVTPQFASVALSGTNLVFNGTNGNPGAQFVILASPNINAPLSSWTPVLTDVFNGSGTFVVTNAIDPTTPLQFFAIRTP